MEEQAVDDKCDTLVELLVFVTIQKRQIDPTYRHKAMAAIAANFKLIFWLPTECSVNNIPTWTSNSAPVLFQMESLSVLEVSPRRSR